MRMGSLKHVTPSIKLETSQNLPPVLQIVPCTAQLLVDISYRRLGNFHVAFFRVRNVRAVNFRHVAFFHARNVRTFNFCRPRNWQKFPDLW